MLARLRIAAATYNNIVICVEHMMIESLRDVSYYWAHGLENMKTMLMLIMMMIMMMTKL